MNIEFHTKFDRETTDKLWDQGVCMDDWDYAIICPPDVVVEEEYPYEESEWEWFPFVEEKDRVWEKVQTSETSWHYRGPDFSKGHYVTKEVKKKRWTCPEYDLDRMLTGCCSNTWYLIEWNGEKKAIGVAYHA